MHSDPKKDTTQLQPTFVSLSVVRTTAKYLGSVQHAPELHERRRPVTMAKFTLFPLLPFELRDQIWHDVLPSQSTGDRPPALYFYRLTPHWAPRVLTESDPGYRAGEIDLGFYFHAETLAHSDDELDNQFDLPLLFVNREARQVAMKWIRKEVFSITNKLQ
jgi:hypothetical protein